jgi:hypothetical protein
MGIIDQLRCWNMFEPYPPKVNENIYIDIGIFTFLGQNPSECREFLLGTNAKASSTKTCLLGMYDGGEFRMWRLTYSCR